MKMRKILSILLASILVLSFAGCNSKEEKVNSDNKDSGKKPASSQGTEDTSGNDSGNETVSTETTGKEPPVYDESKDNVPEKDKKIVICWGDSITQGMGMNIGDSYPEVLQKYLGYEYKVINAGVPGENSSTISARANVLETCLRNDVTFKKGEAQVKLDRELFIGKNGEDIVLKGFGNKLPIDNVIIGGKAYTIEFEQGTEKETHFYKLTRKDTSSALTLKKGTTVKFDYSKYYSGDIYCNVMLVGANDMPPKADEIIAKYKKIATTAQKNIFLIPFYSQDNAPEFVDAFGNKALNLRVYFQTQALEDFNEELTKGGQICIDKNYIPNNFTYKNARYDCHLNEIGYKAMAYRIYQKGIELKYWK